MNRETSEQRLEAALRLYALGDQTIENYREILSSCQYLFKHKGTSSLWDVFIPTMERITDAVGIDANLDPFFKGGVYITFTRPTCETSPWFGFSLTNK